MLITGTPGDDFLPGTTDDDLFDLTQGGNDKAVGDLGNDTFKLGAAFSAADRINGALGNDILKLDGDYSTGVLFNNYTINNIETISLHAGNNYMLTAVDANVTAGQTLTVDASELAASDSLRFDGAAEKDGRFSFIGGHGDDFLTGGSGADSFDLRRGGADVARGGVGSDTFLMGSTFAAADHINGGGGSDTLILNGGPSHAIVFDPGTLVSVETIQLTAGHSYALTTADTTVHAGRALTVDGSTLGAGDALTLDVSAETNGLFDITGGAANDTFNFGAAFKVGESIDGGAGSDTLNLNGDYSAFVDLRSSSLSSVEEMTFGAGFNYWIYTGNGVVAAGDTLTVYAGALGPGDSLRFAGDLEIDGKFNITGGAGNDKLGGGHGADTFTGGMGVDKFDYNSTGLSISSRMDTITDFNASQDQFYTDVQFFDGIVNASVSTASIDADIAAALPSLQWTHGALINVTGGTLSGHALLVLDWQGPGTGYNGGTDYVIDVTGYTGTWSDSSFTLSF